MNKKTCLRAAAATIGQRRMLPGAVARVHVPMLVMLVVGALVGACGDEEPPPPAPQIVDVTLSSARLMPDQTVTITAVVLPSGPETPIASVQLVRGAVQIAPFEEDGPGVFVATATWAALAGDDLRGLMDEMVDAPATVRAVDTAGHSAERTTAVTLVCSFEGEAICHGGCVYAVEDSHHCGGCDQDCTGEVTGPLDTTRVTCRLGLCGTGSGRTDDRQSCDETCASFRFQGRSMTCVPRCRQRSGGTFDFNDGTAALRAFYTGAAFGVTNDSCDAIPASTYLSAVVVRPYEGQACCCAATFPPLP